MSLIDAVRHMDGTKMYGGERRAEDAEKDPDWGNDKNSVPCRHAGCCLKIFPHHLAREIGLVELVVMQEASHWD